jgi:6-phosphogluconolactonase
VEAARMMRGRVTVVEDAQALARAAAEALIARLSDARERPAVALTGGRTPEALYSLLATAPYRTRIAWQHVHWFWGDERFVPHDEARNNARMAIDALLSRVPVPPANIHRIRTDVPSPAESARLYEEALREFHGARPLQAEPLFDVVLMGMGSDGHTASLYAGDSALVEKERWVVPVAQAKLEPFVPRVTLTFPALASTRQMLFLVAGADKRDALERIERGEALPAGRATSNGDLAWLISRDAKK